MRRRTVVGVSAVAAAIALVAGMSVVWPGLDAQDTPPRDAAVWVLQADGLRYARVNTAVGELGPKLTRPWMGGRTSAASRWAPYCRHSRNTASAQHPPSNTHRRALAHPIAASSRGGWPPRKTLNIIG